jgi:hypothetical protein
MVSSDLGEVSGLELCEQLAQELRQGSSGFVGQRRQGIQEIAW